MKLIVNNCSYSRIMLIKKNNKYRISFSGLEPWLIIVAVFSFILFHKPIEDFLSISIIKYLLCHVEEIWYNDIIIGITIISWMIWCVNNLSRNFHPSLKFTLLSLIISIVYAKYRFFESPWDFQGFSIFPEIKYADLTFIALAGQLFLYIKKWEKPDKKSEKLTTVFIHDQPIRELNEDILGQSFYANEIAKRIQQMEVKEAFTIGINGRWGNGKTSFINLIKKQIEKDDLIEIDFNPWRSDSSAGIITDFFTEFQEGLKPHFQSSSRLFRKYGERLSGISSGYLSQIVEPLRIFFFGKQTLYDLFTEINQTLIKSNKRIVIYIDDIDRLDNNEILEVLKLVRNTANFHNTFFILAYDRNYVNAAISEQNKHQHEFFIEKIVQLEVTLPMTENMILRNSLAEKLKAVIPDKHHSSIEIEIQKNTEHLSKYLDDWLCNMRDVNRLFNMLSIDFSILAGEVEFRDILRIELLRLKFPAVYELLYRKREDYLTEIQPRNGDKKNKLTLRKHAGEKKHNNEEGSKITCIEYDLVELSEDFSIPSGEASKVGKLIAGLFNSGEGVLIGTQTQLSIVNPSKFDRYFAFRLFDGSLSEIEFSKARESSQEEFNQKISEWVEKKMEREVYRKFREIVFFDSREDCIKIIKGILHYANQNSQFGVYRDIPTLIQYDSNDIANKLHWLYSSIENPETKDAAFHDTFIEMFKDATRPYQYESLLVQFIRTNGIFENISKEDLLELNINYLQDYCNEIMKFDRHVWDLFYRCGEGNNECDDKAKEILQVFILQKDIEGFIREIIVEHSHKKGLYCLKNRYLLIFGSKEEFEKLVMPALEAKSSYFDEFVQFQRELKAGKFDYIPFQFKVIPIE